MQTVEQALRLLDLFSERQPQCGLSELARQAGFDKAKTRRHLMALIKRGLIEQSPETKQYRLGAALLRLARVREACFPLATLVTPILHALVANIGETAHFSLMSGETLGNICVVESPRAHRITMEKGEILPLHATASGLALLAHSPADFVAEFLRQELTAFTSLTVTAPQRIARMLAQIRQRGFARAVGSYDDGVTSFAVPIRGLREFAVGALAIAAPTSRVDKHIESLATRELRSAADAIESAVSGGFVTPAGADALKVSGL